MKKSKEIYKYIKIILIVLIVFLIIISFLIGNRITNENTKNAPIYSTIESMPDVQTLINQMYGKFIKIEDSKDEKYFKDIYVDLKYALYEGEESKKDFYNALVTNVAQNMTYQNIRVIDEEKGIELKIICDIENQKLIGSYINGDTNFYGHYESQKALANYEKTPVTNFSIQSNEINTLIQNNWNKNELNIGKVENKVDKYFEYAEYGINIYELDEKVFHLYFDERYTSPVINDIKVGESFENIIKVLGTQTFGSVEEDYIGYKGEKMYIFFNKNQISIYPVERNSNTNLSELIEKYENDGSIKKMVSNATDIWENYENYYYDEYTVDLSYPHNGVKFQFGITNDNGIIIYNNYDGKIFDNHTQEELKDLEIEIPSYIYFVNEDCINEYERDRNNSIRSTSEDGDFEDLESWKYI